MMFLNVGKNPAPRMVYSPCNYRFSVPLAVNYNNLAMYTSYNSSGYASANLQMLSLQYELFQNLPFNFCGEWVQNSYGYSNVTCPYDGYYHFDLNYQLPPNEDKSSWFASGWTATSEITIKSSRSESASILADCKLEFHTYVTQNQESEWQSLPSAAVVTLSLLGAALAMCVVICCLACRKKTKRVTDRDFDEFQKMQDDDDDTKGDSDDESVNIARKIARKMRYGEPGVPDWA